MIDEFPYRFFRKLGSAVDVIAQEHVGQLRSETQAALAERDARLDRVEALVLHHRHAASDVDGFDICQVAHEVLATQDDGLWWQFCEEHQLVEPDARRLVERWNRG